MHAAHEQQIIHRDLKPANVLLTKKGTPKITDFGLAKKLDDAGQTHTGAIMGTPSYMAPEQAKGETKDLGPAADVYALGAILYEMLTGRAPFKGPTPLETIMQVIHNEPVPLRQLQSTTPRDLETICLKCLQKNLGNRYEHAKGLAEDLHRFQADEPILARPVGPVERFIKWARKRPAAAALYGMIFLLLIIAVVGAFWFVNDQTDRRLRIAELEVRTDHVNETVNAALDEAENILIDLRGQINGPLSIAPLLSDIHEWKDTVARAGQAWQRAKLLSAKNDALLDPQTTDRLQTVHAVWRQEEKHYELAKELDDIRLGVETIGLSVDTIGEGQFDSARAGQKYATFFKDHFVEVARDNKEKLLSAS